jgi:hypothetical protein
MGEGAGGTLLAVERGAARPRRPARAVPLLEAVDQGGATVVGTGRISVDDLVTALDLTAPA